MALVDLPIARLRGTGIPFLPGSSIKGVLRQARQPDDERPNELTEPWQQFLAVFGPDATRDDASDHAGSLVVGDARLLLLPVRSLRGTFAYATSPLLLRLASQDLHACECSGVPAVPLLSTACTAFAGPSLQVRGKLFLEDLDLKVEPQGESALKLWADFFASRLLGENKKLFTERFAIVDDETMSFLWETATQVDARIRIGENGVVEQGALWSEESLPAESVLLGLCAASAARRSGVKLDAQEVLDLALKGEASGLQFGGKATVGRGRARLLPLEGVR